MALPTASGTTLLAVEGGGVRPVAAPQGRPLALAAVSGRLYLASVDAGTTTLWEGRLFT